MLKEISESGIIILSCIQGAVCNESGFYNRSFTALFERYPGVLFLKDDKSEDPVHRSGKHIKHDDRGGRAAALLSNH